MNEFFGDMRERLQEWSSNIQFSSVNKRALAVISVLVIVLSVAVVSRGHSDPVVEVAPILLAPPMVVVDVAGGVKNPGVYSLTADSRVTDAIAAAGGVQPGADVSDVNLARIIKDGEQIYVEPVVAVAPAASNSSKRSPLRIAKKRSGPININRATANELDALPGIGPVLAARIISYRKVNGPFTSVDDLQKVSGIGSAKFAEFKSKVRV